MKRFICSLLCVLLIVCNFHMTGFTMRVNAEESVRTSQDNTETSQGNTEENHSEEYHPEGESIQAEDAIQFGIEESSNKVEGINEEHIEESTKDGEDSKTQMVDVVEEEDKSGKIQNSSDLDITGKNNDNENISENRTNKNITAVTTTETRNNGSKLDLFDYGKVLYTSPLEINSLYKDVIKKDEAEKEFNRLTDDSNNTLKTSLASDIHGFTSKSEAARYLREKMAQHEEVISFMIDYVGNDYDKLYNELYDTALEEQNSGKYGDALKFGIRVNGGSIEYAGEEKVKITYKFTYWSSAEQEQEFDTKVNNVLAEMRLNELSESEKIERIHNYICNNVDYDQTYEKHSAYDALCSGEAVCQGYATLFYRFAKDAGLSTRIISGIGGGDSHAWNIVKLGDVYYNIDCTWDGQGKELLTTYYLKNENEFFDHKRDEEYTTSSFVSRYPMAKESYFEYMNFDEPLNLSNLHFEMKDVHGNNITTDGDEGGKLLIFYMADGERNGDYISNIESLKNHDVEIIAMDLSNADSDALTSFISKFGDSSITFAECNQKYGGIAARYAYQYKGSDEKGNVSFSIPFVIYVDQNNKIQHITEDTTDVSLLNQNIKHYIARNTTESLRKINILKQPEDVQTEEGVKVKYSIEAEGDELSYQWQYSKDNGKTWKNSGASGNKTSTVTFKVSGNLNGSLYRCVVTDRTGKNEISTEAKLTIKKALAITKQPEDVQTEEGVKVKYSIEAEGDELSYQWQYSKDNGKTWKNSGASGNKTSTVTFKVSGNLNGSLYRCVVTDRTGKNEISTEAKLTIKKALVITKQPETSTATPYNAARFTVVASGENLRYRWEYSNDGQFWEASMQPGADTDTLYVPAKSERNGFLYRCVVSNENGQSVTSNPAKLIVSTISIYQQPYDIQVPAGSAVSFVVRADGEELQYQWQINSGDGWQDAVELVGNHTDELTVPTLEPYYVAKFRCVITDVNGATETTDEVKLIKVESSLDTIVTDFVFNKVGQTVEKNADMRFRAKIESTKQLERVYVNMRYAGNKAGNTYIYFECPLTFNAQSGYYEGTMATLPDDVLSGQYFAEVGYVYPENTRSSYLTSFDTFNCVIVGDYQQLSDLYDGYTFNQKDQKVLKDAEFKVQFPSRLSGHIANAIIRPYLKNSGESLVFFNAKYSPYGEAYGQKIAKFVYKDGRMIGEEITEEYVNNMEYGLTLTVDMQSGVHYSNVTLKGADFTIVPSEAELEKKD